MSWLAKLKQGLTKTSDALNKTIANVVHKRKLDQTMLDELEEALIMADIGVNSASKIIAELSKRKFDKEIALSEVKVELADIIAQTLDGASSQLSLGHVPEVVLMCGVNGSGKTTTIGKIAAQLQEEGKKVMVVACDTFRAAAIEQLKVWAQRLNIAIIEGPENSDPASIAFKAINIAKEEGYDVVLIDTAGRLHNKTNLMEELAKIIRVLKKVDDSAPHEVVLVLDATTGQNVMSQLEAFKNFVNVSGLVVTKLDGTAKAGMVVALYDKYKLPIYYIGVGEKAEDLSSFSAQDYANNLLGI